MAAAQRAQIQSVVHDPAHSVLDHRRQITQIRNEGHDAAGHGLGQLERREIAGSLGRVGQGQCVEGRHVGAYFFVIDPAHARDALRGDAILENFVELPLTHEDEMNGLFALE